MEYKKEIRDSEIRELEEKVEKRNYGQYLLKLRLNPVRGFKDNSVSFDFPVTALIGPNGGGKTTVLGAAACAYISIKPSRFFAKSGKLDDSMQNWKINYELVDKKVNPHDSFSKVSKFTNYKWTRDNVARSVAVFGVSRTVPANERHEFRKCASTYFKFSPKALHDLSPSVISAAEKILGKNLSGYSKIDIGTNGRVSLLRGQTEEGVSFSEFHFGAGESSIIKMLIEIESLPENSLILIEEIENGLHPLATIRMVEYLIDMAKRKKSQTIFTTHSNDALLILPPKAIWTALNNTFYQGKLDVKSLRTMTGKSETQLVIYVEDEFAKIWVETIISSDSDLINRDIEVYSMYGDGTAVSTNLSNNSNPSKKCSSICIIDGDSSQKASDEANVYRLPGDMPERYIYDKVMDLVDAPDSKMGELTVALHRNYMHQEDIKKKLKSVGLTCRDRHVIFSQIGKNIGLVAESVVKSAFLNLWVQNHPNDVNILVGKIRKCMETIE